MKIKISFFKRIFIFSIFIIIITVFLGYIFNIFFTDKFYIHRKARKILIISKDVLKTDTDIIYSYFINKQLIASDVSEIKIFINKFKEYLSL